jgi:hypothetical protein
LLNNYINTKIALLWQHLVLCLLMHLSHLLLRLKLLAVPPEADAAAAQDAAVPPVAAKRLEPVSVVAGNCELDGTHHSLHVIQNLRIYLFFPAQTPIQDHNLVDGPRDCPEKCAPSSLYMVIVVVPSTVTLATTAHSTSSSSS